MGDDLLEVRVIDDDSEDHTPVPGPSTSISSLHSVSCKDESAGVDSETKCDDEANTKPENDKPDASESDGSENQESRQCWVCLATDDEDEETTEWIHPCRCSGSAKWVHQNCLQQWIDEKQKYNSTLSVSCTQCNTEYVLIYTQQSGKLYFAIDLCDRILYSASPLAAITCVVGSIYWSAVCYGAFTVMQVLGKERGRSLIEHSDPLMLLVGLPTIPVVLILSKLIRWEDQILKLWFKNNFRYPLLGYVMGKPMAKSREFTEHNLLYRETMTDPISICRNFCGALILPTAATFFGGLFYGDIESNLNRAILGGITFIIGKGLVKILFRQRQYIRQTHRKILNFANEK